MSSSNKFQKIHLDFAPCHLQTKAPLAQEVEALSGEGHLHPMLNLLCERALHKLLLGEAEGRRISNLKTKAVFSQSVIISLILLWKPCQIPPPHLIYGSIRIPGSMVLLLLGVQRSLPCLCPQSPVCFPSVFLLLTSECKARAQANQCNAWAQASQWKAEHRLASVY